MVAMVSRVRYTKDTMPQEKTQKPEKNRENEPKKTTEASLKANEKAQENTKKALQKKPR